MIRHPTGGLTAFTIGSWQGNVYQNLTNPPTNFPLRNPAYTPRVQFTFEQSLWQSLGIDINQVLSRPPLLGNLLGQVHLRRNQDDDALAAFGRAIETDTAFADAYGNRGTLLAEMKQLPEALAAHLCLHASVQQLTVQAALSGDRRTALQALQLDPATAAVLEPPQIARLLDDLLRANARYLPRFA